MTRKDVAPVEVDVDNAYSACNHSGDYCVYFDVEKRADGWWVGGMVDAEHFSDTVLKADGPYESEDAAIMAGENLVYDVMWHQFKRIYWDERIKQARKKRRSRKPRGGKRRGAKRSGGTRALHELRELMRR